LTPRFTGNGLLRGARDAVPLALGIFLYGVGFGLVAAQAELALAGALAMSAAVFSGSAQLAALNLIATGHFTLWALAATILLVNARYLLFGAALRPWLSAASPAQVCGSLLLTGDANWLLTMRAIERGEADRAYLAGSGLPTAIGWLSGTAVGVAGGRFLPSPEVLAADLLLPAFAATMMAGILRTGVSALPAVIGATAALVLAPLAGPGLAIIGAGLVGAAAAALRARPGA
jgi:predicted branched-subunit amino acid permease